MSNTVAVKNNSNSTVITRVAFTGVMAAIICVITIFRIPLGQSKVHFANSMCLLSGLLLGPAWGGAAAGLGSALYDVMLGGYGLVDADSLQGVDQEKRRGRLEKESASAGDFLRDRRADLCGIVYAEDLAVQNVCGAGSRGHHSDGHGRETDPVAD